MKTVKELEEQISALQAEIEALRDVPQQEDQGTGVPLEMARQRVR